MSDPFTPPPQPPPQPFASSPRPVGGGCGRVGLVGCGALLLLLGIGAVVVAMQGERVVRWLFGVMETSILEKLPDDVSGDERERFERAFDAAVTRSTAGEGDPVLLQRLQAALMETAQRPITREAFLALTAKLEVLAATAPAAAEPGSGEPESDEAPAEEPPPEEDGGDEGAGSTAAAPRPVRALLLAA